MQRQYVVTILAVLVGLAGLGGWLLTRDERSGASQRVTFAVGVTPNSAPVHIAFAEGYFAEQGLDVDIQRHNSGKAALQALLDGEAELATLGDIPFMFAVMRGAKIKVFATLNSSENILSIVANTAHGIAEPNDLAEKKIAVTKGTGGHYFLYAFLTANRIPAADIEEVDLPPDDLVTAIADGTVDAVSTWEPHGLRARDALGGNALTFGGQGIHRETFNVAASDAFLASSADAAAKVVRALRKSHELIRDDPDKAISVVADYTGIDRQKTAAVWDNYDFGLGLEQSLLLTLESGTRWAIDNDLVERDDPPNYLDFLYPDALDKVLPGAVTVVR